MLRDRSILPERNCFREAREHDERIAERLDDLEQLGFERAPRGCLVREADAGELAYGVVDERRQLPGVEGGNDLRSRDRLGSRSPTVEKWREEARLLLLQRAWLVRQTPARAEAAEREHQLGELGKEVGVGHASQALLTS